MLIRKLRILFLISLIDRVASDPVKKLPSLPCLSNHLSIHLDCDVVIFGVVVSMLLFPLVAEKTRHNGKPLR